MVKRPNDFIIIISLAGQGFKEQDCFCRTLNIEICVVQTPSEWQLKKIINQNVPYFVCHAQFLMKNILISLVIFTTELEVPVKSRLLK